MTGHRCHLATCSEDVLQLILEHLRFKERVQLSLTCKAFLDHQMAGSLEIQLAKQGQAQQISLDRLIHLLEGMSAEKMCKIRKLCINSISTGIAELPDSQLHRLCKSLVGNLTVLRLHDVYLQLEALEAPGVELRLEMLDLSGSVLVAKANPEMLEWPLLTSNSSTRRCLNLRNVLIRVPELFLPQIEDPWVEHVVLPRLEQLDITRFGVVNHMPSDSQYFGEQRVGVFHRLSVFECWLVPPENFKGANNLKTVHFSPVCPITWSIAPSCWEHFPHLHSAEFSHGSETAELPYRKLVPLSIKEFTVRLWPLPCGGRTCNRLAKDFQHILKAINAGMRLHKLTLVGFTYSDIRSFANDAEGMCLAGIRELVLEPCLSKADLEVLKPGLIPHPVDQLLHVFPDVERLQIHGQPLTSLTLSVPCPLVDELRLSFCPTSMNMNLANLRNLWLEHNFSIGPAQRAAEVHELDMRVWACGHLDRLTIVVGSYENGDVFRVQCKLGVAISAIVSYPAEKWGEWVIGVGLCASMFGQVRKRAVSFVCINNHGLLTWGLARGNKISSVC